GPGRGAGQLGGGHRGQGAAGEGGVSERPRPKRSFRRGASERTVFRRSASWAVRMGSEGRTEQRVQRRGASKTRRFRRGAWERGVRRGVRMFYEALFWIVAGLTGASAVMVVVTQNIVRAAVWLLFTLVGTSGVYFLLGADFVGATQLIVYVGGTLV